MRIANNMGRSLLLGASAAVLVACGGGGGGSNIDLPEPDPGTSQGPEPGSGQGPDPESEPEASFAIGGTVVGLTGSLILALDGDEEPLDTLEVSGDGSFVFGAALPAQTAYQVRVQEQPADQICMLLRAAGRVPARDVSSVQVECRRDVTVIPSGTLDACFRPERFQAGATLKLIYDVRRRETAFGGFYDVSFRTTERWTAEGGGRSLQGDDGLFSFMLVSRTEALPGAEQDEEEGRFPLTDEPEQFTATFRLYYDLDAVAQTVRYVGAERQQKDGSWVLSEHVRPGALFDFSLEAHDVRTDEAVSFSRHFDSSAAREAIDPPREDVKSLTWRYNGHAPDFSLPSGPIPTCKVTGEGHEISPFVPTPAAGPFELFLSEQWGFPVEILHVHDNSELGFEDAEMHARLVSAVVDGTPVFGDGDP